MNGKTRNKRKIVLIAVVITAAVLATAALTAGIVYAALKDTTSVVKNEMTPATVACDVIETFHGTEKTDVKVQNTGTVPAYIRAKVVINWVDADGNVAYRPSAEYGYNLTMPSPLKWTNGSGSTALTDGYWYYNGVVQPDDLTENLISSITERLVGAAATDPQYHLQVTILGEAIQAAPDESGNSAVGEKWQMTYSGGSWSAYAG